MKSIIILILAASLFASESNMCLESNVKKIEAGDSFAMRGYINNCKTELSEQSLLNYFKAKRQKLLKSSVLLCMGDAGFINRKIKDAFDYYSQSAVLGNKNAMATIVYIHSNFEKEINKAYNQRVEKPYYTQDELDNFKKILNENNRFNLIDSLVKKKNKEEITSYVKNCLDSIQSKITVLNKNLVKLEEGNIDEDYDFKYIEYIYIKDSLEKLKKSHRNLERLEIGI